MSRSVKQDYARYRDPMHISEIMAETFKHQPTPENLTAWVDAGTPAGGPGQPIPGQGLLFCDEVNSEFLSEVPC